MHVCVWKGLLGTTWRVQSRPKGPGPLGRSPSGGEKEGGRVAKLGARAVATDALPGPAGA